MTAPEIQGILEGNQGDDAQFEMMKFVIGQQIDRAFSVFRVSVSTGFEKRNSLQGPFVSYDPDQNGRRNTRS